MDVSNAIIAKSDQLNAVDLLAGERTVQVVDVKPGNAEQPVVIVTDVFGPSRPFKPSKTALRVIVGAWGSESTAWVGRRMTLYRDPAVKWAGEAIGGIRINALSHIPKPLEFNLAVSKGKTAKTIVKPLPDAAPAPQATIDGALKAIHTAPDTTALDAIETKANQLGIGEHVTAAISKRRAELEGAQ